MSCGVARERRRLPWQRWRRLAKSGEQEKAELDRRNLLYGKHLRNLRCRLPARLALQWVVPAVPPPATTTTNSRRPPAAPPSSHQPRGTIPMATSKPFQPVLGRLPSGLFILTIGTGPRATGMLTSWVMQAGLQPPMVSVAVKLGRYVCDWITAGQPFVLNLVGKQQKSLVCALQRRLRAGPAGVRRPGDRPLPPRRAHPHRGPRPPRVRAGPSRRLRRPPPVPRQRRPRPPQPAGRKALGPHPQNRNALLRTVERVSRERRKDAKNKRTNRRQQPFSSVLSS